MQFSAAALHKARDDNESSTRFRSVVAVASPTQLSQFNAKATTHDWQSHFYGAHDKSWVGRLQERLLLYAVEPAG
jgi:hypothetical protein